jgi:cytochrome c5
MRWRSGRFGALLLLWLPVIPGPAGAQDNSAGESIYYQTCVNCHGRDGTGRMRIPDLTGKDGALNKPEAELVKNTINGYSSGSRSYMPPRGGNASLTDQDIGNAIRFMKATFGD